MKYLKIKIWKIYLPFLLTSTGTIAIYALLRWVLDLKLGVLPIKAELLNYWFPFLIPWIPILIWLRKRLRLIEIAGRSDNGYFGYQLLISMAISIPCIISQNYLEKASFALINLKNVNEVRKFENERYFRIADYKIEKEEVLPYFTSRSSGRNNERVTFYLYYSCPFRDANDLWCGINFFKSLSSRMKDDILQKEYRNFIENSENEFSLGAFGKVQYFERLAYSDDRDGYLNSVKRNKGSFALKNAIILIPKSENFDERLGNTFFWIFGSFGIVAIIMMLMILIPKLNEYEWNRFRKGKDLEDDFLKDVWNFIKPGKNISATAILLLVHFLVFLIQVFSGQNISSPTVQELLEAGGNRRSEVLDGEYYRLFTSMFIHSGFMHLLMNMIGMGVGSFMLEKILGRIRLLLIYVLCGACSGLVSIYWHENTVSIGASGAVFGLYGMIMAFTMIKVYPQEQLRSNWILLAFTAGVSLLFGLMGGIDNAAHIGGLIAGFLFAIILSAFERQKLIKRAK
ncbi:MAG: rhomboid family intramembrane serine protease [Flavobacteriales bacterium]|nr:rhomboid family intramembrane serine protease [Flavobacteriales bacterium]